MSCQTLETMQFSAHICSWERWGVSVARKLLLLHSLFNRTYIARCSTFSTCNLPIFQLIHQLITDLSKIDLTFPPLKTNCNHIDCCTPRNCRFFLYIFPTQFKDAENMLYMRDGFYIPCRHRGKVFGGKSTVMHTGKNRTNVKKYRTINCSNQRANISIKLSFCGL